MASAQDTSWTTAQWKAYCEKPVVVEKPTCWRKRGPIVTGGRHRKVQLQMSAAYGIYYQRTKGAIPFRSVEDLNTWLQSQNNPFGFDETTSEGQEYLATIPFAKFCRNLIYPVEPAPAPEVKEVDIAPVRPTSYKEHTWDQISTPRHVRAEAVKDFELGLEAALFLCKTNELPDQIMSPEAFKSLGMEMDTGAGCLSLSQPSPFRSSRPSEPIPSNFLENFAKIAANASKIVNGDHTFFASLMGKTIKEADEKIRANILAEFTDEVKAKVAQQVREQCYKDLKAELHDEVLESLRMELTDYVRSSIAVQHESHVIAELKAKHYSFVIKQLREEHASEVRFDLVEELRPAIEVELRAALKDSVKQSLREQYLRVARSQVREELMSQMREEMMDERRKYRTCLDFKRAPEKSLHKIDERSTEVPITGSESQSVIGKKLPKTLSPANEDVSEPRSDLETQSVIESIIPAGEGLALKGNEGAALHDGTESGKVQAATKQLPELDTSTINLKRDRIHCPDFDTEEDYRGSKRVRGALDENSSISTKRGHAQLEMSKEGGVDRDIKRTRRTQTHEYSTPDEHSEADEDQTKDRNRVSNGDDDNPSIVELSKKLSSAKQICKNPSIQNTDENASGTEDERVLLFGELPISEAQCSQIHFALSADENAVEAVDGRSRIDNSPGLPIAGYSEPNSDSPGHGVVEIHPDQNPGQFISLATEFNTQSQTFEQEALGNTSIIPSDPPTYNYGEAAQSLLDEKLLQSSNDYGQRQHISTSREIFSDGVEIESGSANLINMGAIHAYVDPSIFVYGTESYNGSNIISSRESFYSSSHGNESRSSFSLGNLGAEESLDTPTEDVNSSEVSPTHSSSSMSYEATPTIEVVNLISSDDNASVPDASMKDAASDEDNQFPGRKHHDGDGYRGEMEVDYDGQDYPEEEYEPDDRCSDRENGERYPDGRGYYEHHRQGEFYEGYNKRPRGDQYQEGLVAYSQVRKAGRDEQRHRGNSEESWEKEEIRSGQYRNERSRQYNHNGQFRERSQDRGYPEGQELQIGWDEHRRREPSEWEKGEIPSRQHREERSRNQNRDRQFRERSQERGYPIERERQGEHVEETHNKAFWSPLLLQRSASEQQHHREPDQPSRNGQFGAFGVRVREQGPQFEPNRRGSYQHISLQTRSLGMAQGGFNQLNRFGTRSLGGSPVEQVLQGGLDQNSGNGRQWEYGQPQVEAEQRPRKAESYEAGSADPEEDDTGAPSGSGDYFELLDKQAEAEADAQARRGRSRQPSIESDIERFRNIRDSSSENEDTMEERRRGLNRADKDSSDSDDMGGPMVKAKATTFNERFGSLGM
ncbi:MAG: hypothetical protein M1829_003748 [Trizodia sp. TS-e1964]|nr:MAG: hypothetical protein M1829_003748 [Trizodia sp. TS-e1964]